MTSTSASDEDTLWRSELADPGVLVAATEGDFPPFSFVLPDTSSSDLLPKQKVVGIEISAAAEVCRRLKIEYQPVVVSWRDILRGLGNELDVGNSNREEPNSAEGEATDQMINVPVPCHFDISTASMDITPERQERFLFTRPYYCGAAVVCLLRRYQTLTDAQVKHTYMAPLTI